MLVVRRSKRESDSKRDEFILAEREVANRRAVRARKLKTTKDD